MVISKILNIMFSFALGGKPPALLFFTVTLFQSRAVFPYQLLGEPRRSPLIRDGVEGGVLPRHNGVGDDHAVPFVNADAVPSFHPGSERGILGIRQQAANFPVILQVGAQAVILLAAFA